MSEKRRTDRPKCPYCDSQLALFASTGQVSNAPPKVQSIVAPKYLLEWITLYCTSAECKGRSLSGRSTGYDIKLTDI